MVIIMLSYARSGGTMLNQCLGSLPDTVMMSEVNPLGGGWGVKGSNSYTTIQAQALNWYDIEIKSESFTESVIELERYCEANGKKLIIRDWSFVNFSKCDDNGNNPPYKFMTLDALKSKCDLSVFVFIRDSINIWISRGMPAINDFFFEYLQYIKAVRNLKVPIFKYENFCMNPQFVLKDICDYTGLEYRNVTKTYFYFNKVNGDVQNIIESRGIKTREITLLPRVYIPVRKIFQINRCSFMKKCNEIMGYMPCYYQGKKLNWWKIRILSGFRALNRKLSQS